MKLRPALVAALLCLALTTSAQTQSSATITGKVVDAQGAPLPGVTITLVAIGSSATTATDGHYTLSAPAGSHTLRATIADFGWREEQVELQGKAVATVDFVLSRMPARLISWIAPPESVSELFASASMVAHIRVTASEWHEEARLTATVVEQLKPATPNPSSVTFYQERWSGEPTPYAVGAELIVFLTGEDRLVRLHGPLAVFLLEGGTIRPSKFLSPSYSHCVGRPVEDLLHELRGMREGQQARRR